MHPMCCKGLLENEMKQLCIIIITNPILLLCIIYFNKLLMIPEKNVNLTFHNQLKYYVIIIVVSHN